MAREVYSFPVTIAPGTTAAAPLRQQMLMPPREVQEVEVLVPPGPRGEVGFRVGSSGTQILPTQAGQWVITDSEVLHWPLEGLHDSGSWEFTGYNTGLHPHTLTVRFLVNLPGGLGPAAGPAPIAGNQLASAPSANFGPPPVELPPLPVIPELGLPPAPVISSLGLPPAPALPGAPGVPGVAGTGSPAPQPAYNWWYSDMGKVLSYPIQDGGGRFDELYVRPDGEVVIYGWRGGAGQWESWTSAPFSLGGTVVEVSGAWTLYQGKIRLNVVGTTAAGRRFLKVIDGETYATILDWTPAPDGQPPEKTLHARAAEV